MPQTERTSFTSGRQRCAAWLTRPGGDGPHPAVVLVHGFGATHDMRLAQYEQAFAAGGLATLSFDFRNLGESEGEPRQLVSIRRQLADIEAALDFLRHVPDVDADRLALWGTSLGATHVMLAAAKHPELAAAVVQCPVVDTRNAACSSGLRAVARLIGPVADDLVRAAFGFPRRYIGIVDDPGRTAVVTVPGAKEGWHSMVPPGIAFDNRVTAATGVELAVRNAARKAALIRMPLLVCVSDQETLMDPRIAAGVARRAPRGIAIHYPADHFAVYHPPLVGRIIGDQLAFLGRCLTPATVDGVNRA